MRPTVQEPVLQIPTPRLLRLQCLEKGLEVPLAETAAALALDCFIEQRGPVFDRLANKVADYCTVKLAVVVELPPGVVTVIGPLVAPDGTVANT